MLRHHRSQSVSDEIISTQRHGGFFPTRLKNNKQRKKKKTDIAIPQGRATELHGEVSRVVVFYCGDDRLDELEENQKIPENLVKENTAQNLLYQWIFIISLILCNILTVE